MGTSARDQTAMRPGPNLSINSKLDNVQDQECSIELSERSPTLAGLLNAPTLQRSGSARSSRSAGLSTLCTTPNDDSSLKFNYESPWKTGDKFYETPKELEAPEKDSWEVAYDLAKKHDKDMCAAYREEIDHLIVFAGLFSATVVAFLVISYQMLKPDPTQIQNQVYIGLYTMWAAAYQANGDLFDVQIPPPPTPPPSAVFTPSSSVLRMNVVWFLSLTLSLGTVLIGIICLQWIREFERDTRRGPKEAFALRQMRYDGINYWRVPLIVSALPVLLQSSLLLFFWGMQEFLWSLNQAVTLINSIAIGAILFFIVATITLPALQCIFIRSDGLTQHQCPYKSPQARIFSLIAFRVAILAIKVLQLEIIKGPMYLHEKRTFLEKLLHGKWSDWVSFDNAWQKPRLMQLPGSQEFESCDLPRGMAWLGRKYVHKRESMQAIHHFIRNTHPSTGLSALKKLNEMNPSSLIFKFEPQWNQTAYQKNIIFDILSTFFLENQVQKDHRRHLPLLNHRAELFIRIANYRVAIQRTPEPGSIEAFIDACLEEVPCPLNPFLNNHDYTAVLDVFKYQLLLTFKNYLTTGIFPFVLWNIVKPLVFHTTTSQTSIAVHIDERLRGAVDSFNLDLETYFVKRQDLSQPNLELKLTIDLLHHVFQYSETSENTCHHISDHFPKFNNSMFSLKNALKEHVERCSRTANFLETLNHIIGGDRAIYHNVSAFQDFLRKLY